MENITSPSNTLVRQILKLEKKRERQAQKLIVVEGIREIEKLVNAGNQVRSLVFNESWNPKELDNYLKRVNPDRAVMASPEVFTKISYRSGVANAVAVCDLPSTSLDTLKLKENPLIIVLESLEKPGNIGAIFRSADAAGVDAIVLSNPLTDLFNPNTIRASLGTLFSIQHAEATNQNTYNWLTENKISIISTYLEATDSHFSASYSGPTAIVMGTEATGISNFWIEHSQRLVKIPMHGEADSMNVSTSSAVMMYEAVRQRLAR